MHPNVQDEVGYTLLHHATLNGHTEVVNFLLSCGASTTIPDSSGKERNGCYVRCVTICHVILSVNLTCNIFCGSSCVSVNIYIKFTF